MASKKILTRLMDYVDQQRTQWGSVWDGPVMLTKQEHDLLKTELGSTGGSQILTVEGVKILIGSVSDLPPVPESEAMALAKKWLDKPLFLAKPEPATIQVLSTVPKPEDPTFTNPIIGPKKPYTPGQSFVVGKKEPEPKLVKVYHKSGSDEHSTPQALFDRLDDEFHFDLDVCATAPKEVPNPDVTDSPVEPYTLLDPGNAKCPIYFTKDDDGLKQQWFGRVFVNPPYGHGQVGVWIQKLLKELLAGRITLGVALTAARPDTQWFHTVASYACEIRFLKGRLTFEGEKNAAPFPSVILVFDPTKTSQIVKFWDWHTNQAPVYWKTPGYAFTPGKAGHPGMAVKIPKLLALVK